MWLLVSVAVVLLMPVGAAAAVPPTGELTPDAVPPTDELVADDSPGDPLAPSAVAPGGATAQDDPASGRAAQSGDALVGLFRLAAGDCGSGDPTGSYFRMVQPGGTADEGPYVNNGDSPCEDGSVTPLEPGTDGGVLTDTFQTHPDPAFNGSGGGVADRITQPAQFFGSGFAVATENPDRQTGDETQVPTIVHDGAGGLSGQTSAFGVAYNTQFYNQGAPKPDGSTPGITTDGISGTYDPATGAFTIDWVSTIDGGAFNNFSGVWHLEGTFEASGGGSSGSAGDDDGSADPGSSGGETEQQAATAAEASADAAESAAPGADGELARTGPSAPATAGMVLLLIAAIVGGRRERLPS